MNYGFLYGVCWVIFHLWHPIFRVKGRQNVPQGSFLLCANHRGMADPFWILLALRLPRIPRIMAKDVLMHIPLLGSLLRYLGVIGVKRGENDLNAVKASLRALKKGETLMIFPEGTRVKCGKTAAPKSGAIMLAHRTNTPILPVYIEQKRFPFSPMRCVIGEPYSVTFDGEKPSIAQQHEAAQELMQKIYALGEEK